MSYHLYPSFLTEAAEHRYRHMLRLNAVTETEADAKAIAGYLDAIPSYEGFAFLFKPCDCRIGPCKATHAWRDGSLQHL